MPNAIEKFDQGSQILQNVDVTSIITGLALGVADAQEKLDDNSIRQISKLAETEVAGKSLLQLGFVPAFYAFDFIDISASINLKMALKEEESFALSIYADYSKNTNFDKEFFKQIEKNKENSLSKFSEKSYHKGIKASFHMNLEVEGKSKTAHQEKGSFKMVEDTVASLIDENKGIRCETQIIDNTTIENQSSNDVNIFKSDGYIVVSIPEYTKDHRAILKLNTSDFTGSIKLNSNSTPVSFDKDDDFTTTYNNAATANEGIEVGFFGGTMYTDNGLQKPLVYYFKFGRYSLNDEYSNSVESGSSIEKNDLKKIALLLAKDSDLTIKLRGHTDKSGSYTYNVDLSKNRALAIKNFILSEINQEGFDSNRIEIEYLGESKSVQNDETPWAKDRRVDILFPDGFGYIYFEGGKIDENAVDDDSTESDVFIHLNSTTPAIAPTNPVIKFKYGEEEIEINTISSLTYSGSHSSDELHDFYIEKHSDNLYYLLHKDSEVVYTFYNLKSADIDIKVNGKRDKEVDKNGSKIYSHDVERSKDKLKQLSKDIDGNRTFAIGGSLDVRASRQFGMSLEGNASISARMISLPMPTGLQLHIESEYGIKEEPPKSDSDGN